MSPAKRAIEPCYASSILDFLHQPVTLLPRPDFIFFESQLSEDPCDSLLETTNQLSNEGWDLESGSTFVKKVGPLLSKETH